MYELSATPPLPVPGPLHSPQVLSTGIGRAEGSEAANPGTPADAQERASVTPTAETRLITPTSVPQPNRGDADATTATTPTITSNGAAPNSAPHSVPPGDARPRPVFKMKRTGHSGMFPGPFSPRNAAPALKQPSPCEPDASASGGGNAGAPGASSPLKRAFAAISTSDDGTGALDGGHGEHRDKPPPVPDRPSPIPVISIPSSPVGRHETMDTVS